MIHKSSLVNAMNHPYHFFCPIVKSAMTPSVPRMYDHIGLVTLHLEDFGTRP